MSQFSGRELDDDGGIHLVTCQKCANGQYVLRTNRTTHDPFWGCSAYPQCKSTMAFSMIDPETGKLTDANHCVNPTAMANARIAEIRGRQIKSSPTATNMLSPSDVRLVRRVARQQSRPRSNGWSETGPQLRVRAAGYITRMNAQAVVDKIAPDFEKEADIFLMQSGIGKILDRMPLAGYHRRLAYDEAWEQTNEFDRD